MEVSFATEIEQLRLGAGETFHGEGILAITKALLQSGVAYVGGYQGSPVSHLMDVLVQARELMAELGVHVQACSNEASAAAMLGASIHYPLRGAVTWKSIVGTNVAADALSNLASPGVTGGVLMVIGEDYGEGASVIQERTHAYALKCGLILLDPRPQLQNMVNLVEHAFAMSEASHMPAMMELRIRACHLHGSFTARDNVAPPVSTRALMEDPARFDYTRLPRPPGFCIGCPERPVFSAIKQTQELTGPLHIAADIGCHAFGTFEPFSTGHTILGYGMSLASRAGVGPHMARRTLALMGDGGFWHNGLLTGVQSSLFNGDDTVLLIFKNGYTSATGTQDILSTPADAAKRAAAEKGQSLAHANQTIEAALRGLGVQWLRTVHTYEVARMRQTLEEAMSTPFTGLKVIVAEGECQLERQRRLKPWLAERKASGARVQRVKYGVDEDVCTGDHACMRLSGCPTLTLKDNPDPLRADPVATVLDGCVGCGLCGENAHAATLCPSFYRAEIVSRPRLAERLLGRLRGAVTRALRLGPEAAR